MSEELEKPKRRRLTREERQARKARRKARREKRQTAEELLNFEGITVGSARTAVPANSTKRFTRDRRRKNFERRAKMKVVIGGEEKKLSEPSKYMLDMLISEETKEEGK